MILIEREELAAVVQRDSGALGDDPGAEVRKEALDERTPVAPRIDDREIFRVAFDGNSRSYGARAVALDRFPHRGEPPLGDERLPGDAHVVAVGDVAVADGGGEAIRLHEAGEDA